MHLNSLSQTPEVKSPAQGLLASQDLNCRSRRVLMPMILLGADQRLGPERLCLTCVGPLQSQGKPASNFTGFSPGWLRHQVHAVATALGGEVTDMPRLVHRHQDRSTTRVRHIVPVVGLDHYIALHLRAAANHLLTHKVFSLRMHAGMKKMLESTVINKDWGPSVLTRATIATPSINNPPKKNSHRPSFLFGY